MAFPTNCNPRVIALEDSSGCSLTRASVTPMTLTAFEAQGLTEVGMDKFLANAQEAKAAGYVERTLEMLLMGRISNIKGQLNEQKIPGAPSVILPMIYRKQRQNVNVNYWKVSAGVVCPTAGINGVPVSAWDVTFQKTGSTYSTSIPSPERYFIPNKNVIIEYANATTKVAYSKMFKIIAAVNADGGGVYKTKVTLEPNVHADTWAAYSAAEKAPYQPTLGLAYILANTVSDFQSWCYNEPVENTLKLLTFWLQRSRFTFKYNEEFVKVLNDAMLSGYFKVFRSMPIAQRQRESYARFWQGILNSVFFGQPISDKQTEALYTSCPSVVDPNDTDCVLEYLTNSLGFEYQLNACSRYTDHLGNPLSLDTLLPILYDVKLARQSSGETVTDIDLMTDRFTAGAILDMFVSYFKAKYGMGADRHYTPNAKLNFQNWQDMHYNKFDLPPELGGFTLNVFWDEFFDFKLAAADSGDTRNRVRSIWALDWSDLEFGVADNKSVQRKTNELDELYRCVIEPNVTHYMLKSMQFSALLNDANRHYMVRNFTDSCPTLSVAGCSV